MKPFDTFNLEEGKINANLLDEFSLEKDLELIMPETYSKKNEDTSTQLLNIGLGYRILNKDTSFRSWTDLVMIEAHLIEDNTSSVIASGKIKKFDITRTAPPKNFDVTKTLLIDPIILNNGSYTLTFKSKFAIWGFAGGGVLFAGGAEVYLNGRLYRTVKFQPTKERPYSENEIVNVKIVIDNIS